METRLRQYDQRSSSGSRTEYYNAYESTALLGASGTCDDVVDNWEADNPLDINHYYVDAHRLNGTSEYSPLWGISKFSFSGWPLDYEAYASLPSPDMHTVNPDWAQLAWQGAAFMNPQAPAINLPAILGESRDIPGMLSDLPRLLGERGRGALKAAGRPARRAPRIKPTGKARAAAIWAAARTAAAESGSQYVGTQFGWKPMVQDLATLCELSAAIAQQLEWLLRLMQGRTIRRRMSLPGQDTATDSGELHLHTMRATVMGRYTDVFRVKSWMTARYAATPFLTASILSGANTPEGMVDLAMRLATGMTTMGLMQAWWELMPWSWLIDWWYNVGRILAALGNSLALRLVSLCYMRTSMISRYYSISSVTPSWASVSGSPTCRRVRRWRKPMLSYMASAPPLVSSLPVLTGRQSGILGGLLAQAQHGGLRR